MNAIEVRDLVKRYRACTALDGISFDVAQGELFCLLGPNGAGKTTTASILTTILAPTSGDVRVGGVPLSDQRGVRRQVGIVFQGPSLDLNLTAEENIRLHAVLYGLYPWRPMYRLMPRAYKEQVADLAGLFDVPLGRPVRALSGGNRRKLELIRALLHRPSILFLDEPTSGLDPESRRSLWAYLDEARRDGTTMFLTTHYLEEAEGAGTVCVLVKGRVIESGTPAEVKARQARPKHLLLDADDRPRLLAELAELPGLAGLAVTGAGPVRVTLDGLSAQQVVARLSVELTVMSTVEPTLEDTYLSLLEQGVSRTTELSAFAAIAQRDVTKLLRDRVRLAVSLALPVALILGIGTILQPTVGKVTGLNSVTLAFVGVLAATLFQSAAAGMLSIVEDRDTDFSRELFVTPVSRLTLVAGRVAGETLVALCQGVCIVIFARLIGVPISLGQLGALVLPCIASCLLGAAFGLAALSALPNQRSAMQVFEFLILPQYVLAGVLVPLRGLSTWLAVLSWAMPLRYPVGLTQAAFYAGTPGYRKVVTASPVLDIAVMVALFVVLVGVGTAVLTYRERR